MLFLKPVPLASFVIRTPGPQVLVQIHGWQTLDGWENQQCAKGF